MDYLEILEIIAKAGSKEETVRIYYPETETRKAGWREIEPYSLTTDLPPEGEHLIYPVRGYGAKNKNENSQTSNSVYKKDRLSPGHILNAYTIGIGERHCHSFIIGKIKKARFTGRKFIPRWKVEF